MKQTLKVPTESTQLNNSSSSDIDDFEDVPDKPDFAAYLQADFNRVQSLENRKRMVLSKSPSRRYSSKKSEKSLISLSKNQDLEKFILQAESQKSSQSKVVSSLAKDMDLSNSWHKNDGYVDKKWEEGFVENKSSTVDKSGPVAGFSADMSVAMFEIPSTDFMKPISHICGAKLENGGLCQRQDRVKCPFHGKIVKRDEEGNTLEADGSLVKQMFAPDEKPNRKRKSEEKTKKSVKNSISKNLNKLKRK